MKIAVIGAGASGMMAAITAARQGADVFVVERNSRPGIKLNITGKGRCNVTNACDVQTMIKNVPGNGRFLYSAFNSFDSAATVEFFESAGVLLKTERGDRIFPVSDRAMDVTDALVLTMKKLNIKIITDKAVEIKRDSNGVSAVVGEHGHYACDKVILASGGRSYPKTGSDGSGYKLAKALGHTITKIRPSLVPLEAKGNIPARLEGLSLRNIRVSLLKNGEEIYSDFGEMIFTRHGVSGPVILSSSAHVAREELFPCILSIDLKPALDEQTLDKRVIRDFEENLNRDFANSLGKLLPSKLIPVIVELSGIPGDKKVNVITKTERASLVHTIKAFQLEITGAGPFEEAIITAGGVSVKEIDPRTMESKLVPGLYFAGEIIDVDAYTGGFNLQIAWSTGFKAGLSAAGEDELFE
ncbi:MAG: NAD(P)/FAD-dependent oxidoreductase [Clostridiaceae bacterium]|nr:NAD(P)/FAD-dependent oxidoreductase [Clostridiaceae bacterium]